MINNNPSQTVLIIDDESSLLFGISTMVKRAGYQVLVANSGKDGLQLAQEHHPDLIVCDVMMPSPNGLELCQMLSNNTNTRDIPFIFLTSRARATDKMLGFRAGADDYITKPFKREELLARIEATLRRVSFIRQKEEAKAQSKINQLRQEVLKNITHELRTPISLLLQTLSMSLMERFKNNPTAQEEFLQTALNNAHDLQTITNDLIILSQLDQGIVNNFRQVLDPKMDFHPLVEKIGKRWQSKNLNLAMTIEPGVIIHAPRAEFRQAVGHLIDNACKFSSPNAGVQIFLGQNGVGGCKLTIINQGATIPQALREKVFERFYQISQGDARQNNGLGVGLTIARAFARALGGDVMILDSNSNCWIKMIIPPGKADWE